MTLCSKAKVGRHGKPKKSFGATKSQRGNRTKWQRHLSNIPHVETGTKRAREKKFQLSGRREEGEHDEFIGRTITTISGEPPSSFITH